jgi:hypothetical protein
MFSDCPMEKDHLILKRSSASRPSGEWLRSARAGGGSYYAAHALTCRSQHRFMGHSHRLSKKLHSLLDGYGSEIARADLRPSRRALRLHADAPPQVIQEGEMIEFLAQMPSDTMIFITTAVLGLAATLIGLKWLI